MNNDFYLINYNHKFIIYIIKLVKLIHGIFSSKISQKRMYIYLLNIM